MGKKMTFLGFVGWYLGSLVVSLALLVGLLCLWSWKWHKTHAEEVRERAAYFAEQEAREDAWRHPTVRKASEPVRTHPKARKTPSRSKEIVSDGERKVALAARCYGAMCTSDIRDSMKIPQ